MPKIPKTYRLDTTVLKMLDNIAKVYLTDNNTKAIETLVTNEFIRMFGKEKWEKILLEDFKEHQSFYMNRE